jgi:hypothetical protein
MATQLGGHAGSCRLDLSTSLAAAAHARAFVRRQLVAWEIAGPVAIDAVGCVSELVQLILAQSAGLPSVELLDDEGYIMVAVITDGPSVGRPPTRVDDFGVLLLTELADDWGDYTDEHGRPGTWCMLMV